MASICACSRFMRKIMTALDIDRLEEKYPDASDIDLALGEIDRLKQVDKVVRKIHERWGDTSEALFEEIRALIKD